ncbi:putative variant ionotropic glutamate receptor-like 25, partial [Homarus americanus]
FRSSLIAHLTVPGKSQTLDTLQDLADADGWRWGTEPWQVSGAIREYYSKNTELVMTQIMDEMEWYSIDVLLEKVLQGGFSFICSQKRFAVYVASWYANSKGETPFYVSNKAFSLMLCFGWSFRKGAPFYRKIALMTSWMQDAGIIDYWTEEVMARRVRENRETAALNLVKDTPQDDETQVILGMGHLQGAFYLLILGTVVAFLGLLWENYAQSCYPLHLSY